MLPDLTPNLYYMIGTFTFLGIYSDIEALLFSTLTDPLNFMINDTLINHYGVVPTAFSISLMQSIFSSIGTAGVLLSTFFLMPLAESRGRKFLCVHVRFLIGFTSSLLYFGSAVFQAAELFIIAQTVNDLLVPIRMFLTIIFVGECTPDKHRGFSSTCLVVSGTIGQVIMYSITSPSLLGTPYLWFILPLITAFLSFIMLIFTIRLPESPKWLVRMNRMDEAKRSILYYHGNDCDINSVLTSFIKEKNLTKEKTISLRDIYANDTLREAAKLLIVIDVFMMFTTGFVESTFAIAINKSAGISVQTTLTINLVMSLFAIPTRFIGPFLVDSLGRRRVLFLGAAFLYSKMVIMMIAQWITFETGPGILPIVMIIMGRILTEAYHCVGVGALDSILVGELFPPSARNPMMQFLLMFSFAGSFPLMAVYPMINALFPPAYYFPFLVLHPFLILYLYRNLPETKNRSVCDIIESLDDTVASRHPTLIEECTPLIHDRNRSLTFANKRRSILITPRTRALTHDYKFVTERWNC